MKQTKRMLTVLLALLMLLALGAGVAAEDAPQDSNWAPIPTSPVDLSDGDIYLDFTDFLTEAMRSGERPRSDDEIALAIQAYSEGAWLFDYDACKLKGAVTLPAGLSDSGEEEVLTIPEEGGTQWLPYILKEVGARWYPVTEYNDSLWDGRYYIDADACTEAQKELLDQAELFYNPGSAYMELKLINGFGEVWYYPMNRDVIGDLVRDLDIHQVRFTYDWTPLPTSPDGLEDGAYYVDFTKFTDMMPLEGDSPENVALFLEMYNNGEFFFDEKKLVFKETVTVPSAFSESGEDETITIQDFIENDGLEIFGVCLREAGARWYPVAKTTEGLQSGDWYIDLSAADAATRERLSACDIYVNPNGRLEKYLVVPAEFRPLDHTGDFFPLMTRWLELFGPYTDRDDFEPDPYYFWPDVCPVRQYVAPEETNWIALPYTTEGLSDGDWYLDLDAFVDAVGRGKSTAEKAEVRALIEQHVTFSYNPGGEQLAYKYVYTDLPGEDGVPVSGTVVLPLDLTLGSEDAFPYDYNALRQCVRQYHAPADPDAAQQTDGDGGWFQTNVIGRLKSAISAILSFFRRLFNLMK